MVRECEHRTWIFLLGWLYLWLIHQLHSPAVVIRSFVKWQRDRFAVCMRLFIYLLSSSSWHTQKPSLTHYQHCLSSVCSHFPQSFHFTFLYEISQNWYLKIGNFTHSSRNPAGSTTWNSYDTIFGAPSYNRYEFNNSLFSGCYYCT